MFSTTVCVAALGRIFGLFRKRIVLNSKDPEEGADRERLWYEWEVPHTRPPKRSDDRSKH
jgi:hypothetical protein